MWQRVLTTGNRIVVVMQDILGDHVGVTLGTCCLPDN